MSTRRTAGRSAGLSSCDALDTLLTGDEDALSSLLASTSNITSVPARTSAPSKDRERRRWQVDSDSEEDSPSATARVKESALSSLHSRPLPKKKSSTLNEHTRSNAAPISASHQPSLDADANIATGTLNPRSSRRCKHESLEVDKKKQTELSKVVQEGMVPSNIEGGIVTAQAAQSQMSQTSDFHRAALNSDAINKPTTSGSSEPSSSVSQLSRKGRRRGALSRDASSTSGLCTDSSTDPWSKLDNPLDSIEPSSANTVFKEEEKAVATQFVPSFQNHLERDNFTLSQTASAAPGNHNTTTFELITKGPSLISSLGRRDVLAKRQSIIINTTPESLHSSEQSNKADSQSISQISLERWCQWMGIRTDRADDLPLLPLAQQARNMNNLPARYQFSNGKWKNTITGRVYTHHPALARWQRKVSQKRMAFKYKVEADNEDEDIIEFWNEESGDEEVQEHNQYEQVHSVTNASVVSGVIASTSPGKGCLNRLELVRQQPAALDVSSSHGAIMTNNVPLEQFDARHEAAPFVAMEFDSFASTTSSEHMSSVLMEQRRKLTEHFDSHLTRMHASISSYKEHIHKIEIQYRTVAEQLQAMRSSSAYQREEAVHQALEAERNRSESLFQHQAKLHALSLEQLAESHRSAIQAMQTRHQKELALLQAEIRDAGVLQSLSQHIEHSAEKLDHIQTELAQSVSNSTMDREQAAREKLLNDRDSHLQRRMQDIKKKEEALHSDTKKLDDAAAQLQTERALWRSSCQGAEEQDKIEKSRLLTEKQLLLEERQAHITEKARLEKHLQIHLEEAKIKRDTLERKEREMNEWWEDASLKRAAIIAALDEEKAKMHKLAEQLDFKRLALDKKEEALLSDQQNYHQANNLLLTRMEELLKVEQTIHTQSQQLVMEREALEHDRCQSMVYQIGETRRSPVRTKFAPTVFATKVDDSTRSQFAASHASLVSSLQAVLTF